MKKKLIDYEVCWSAEECFEIKALNQKDAERRAKKMSWKLFLKKSGYEKISDLNLYGHKVYKPRKEIKCFRDEKGRFHGED